MVCTQCKISMSAFNAIQMWRVNGSERQKMGALYFRQNGIASGAGWGMHRGNRSVPEVHRIEWTGEVHRIDWTGIEAALPGMTTAGVRRIPVEK
jgi:hypothetical protein